MEQKEKDEKRAAQIVKMLFKDVSGDEISRAQILNLIKPKTFHNYNPLLVDYGLVKPVTKGKTIVSLRLTDKGVQVRNSGAQTQIPVTSVPDNTTIAEKPDLDELTALTDEFNKHSRSWEWKLVRKEVAAK